MLISYQFYNLIFISFIFVRPRRPYYTVNQKKTWQYIFDYNFG